MTPNHNRCIDCTGLFYNESTSTGCGKKGKKSKTLVPFIIILLANWLANKGGAPLSVLNKWLVTELYDYYYYVFCVCFFVILE